MLVTMDGMEKQLKRYRLDSSTPKADRYTESKRQDTQPHWSQDMYYEEKSPRDDTVLFTEQKVQASEDYNEDKTRNKSQYAHGTKWVRPKVRFADNSYGERTGK